MGGDGGHVHPEREGASHNTATLTLNDVSRHLCFLAVLATGAWGHKLAQAQGKGDCALLYLSEVEEQDGTGGSSGVAVSFSSGFIY